MKNEKKINLMYRNFNVSLFIAPQAQAQKSVSPVRDNGTDNENNFHRSKSLRSHFLSLTG